MIGPVTDSRSLGFHTTLVGMKVADANLEQAEQVIAGHPGVSHGYERDHPFNVWFTLALPPASNIETELQELTRSAGAEITVSLPAVRVFKLALTLISRRTGKLRRRPTAKVPLPSGSTSRPPTSASSISCNRTCRSSLRHSPRWRREPAWIRNNFSPGAGRSRNGALFAVSAPALTTGKLALRPTPCAAG